MARVARQLEAPVRSSEGRRLGRVERVLVDVDERRVAALLVRGPGPFPRRRVVPLSAVRSWADGGPVLDARKLPTVRQATAVLGAGIQDRLDDAIGWPVTAASGRRLGAICDLEFDGRDGAIAAIEISRGVVGDLSSGSISAASERIERFSPAGTVLALDETKGPTTIDRVARAVGRGAGKAAGRAKTAAKRAIESYREGRHG